MPLQINEGQDIGTFKKVVLSKNTGTANAHRGTINIIEGANVTLTFTDVPGSDRLDITISSSASSFPGFDTTTPKADALVGAAGSSGIASHSNHVHPAAAIYGVQSAFTSGTLVSAAVLAPTFKPKFGIAFFLYGGSGQDNIGLGFFNGTSTNNQRYITYSPFIGAGHGNGAVYSIMDQGLDRWKCTNFAQGNVLVQRTDGTASNNVIMAVIGQDM